MCLIDLYSFLFHSSLPRIKRIIPFIQACYKFEMRDRTFKFYFHYKILISSTFLGYSLSIQTIMFQYNSNFIMRFIILVKSLSLNYSQHLSINRIVLQVRNSKNSVIFVCFTILFN